MELGKQIRRERLMRSLTLKDVSERTNLSISLLSGIERGKSMPSMASLRLIAQTLGISLMTFREEKENSKPNQIDFSFQSDHVQSDRERSRNQYINDVRVVRAGERKKLAYPGSDAFYEMLSPDLNRLLQVLWCSNKPGHKSGPEIIDPPGEKFLLVLKGSYEFTIRGDAILLNEGDSLYYPADAAVSWKVLGDTPGETLLVITPPGF